jgi:hypothetical protein
LKLAARAVSLDTVMSITDEQVNDVVTRLSRDVEGWGLTSHLEWVRHEATNARSFVTDPTWFEEKVVEDLQQRFMDEFVDTTWPRCPRHFRHPLWYHNGNWVCEEDAVAIARLGELPPPLSNEEPWRLR